MRDYMRVSKMYVPVRMSLFNRIGIACSAVLYLVGAAIVAGMMTVKQIKKGV